MAAFRRLIEEAFGGGKVEVVDEICSADLIEHQAGFDPPSREGVKRGLAFLNGLTPDRKVTIEDMSVDGDRIWARLRARGTHSGKLLGGPTGKPFDFTIMDVCRFRDGKIVEHWGVPDRFMQMQQLGLMPAIGRPAVTA